MQQEPTEEKVLTLRQPLLASMNYSTLSGRSQPMPRKTLHLPKFGRLASASGSHTQIAEGSSLNAAHRGGPARGPGTLAALTIRSSGPSISHAARALLPSA